MECKICQGAATELFKATLLQKYLVQYYKCVNCGFIQTEEPYWLDEAYQSAITSMDVGLVFRNLTFSKTTEKLLFQFFNYKSKFLDYAGGYGLFVRLMRDKGFDFYRQDPYCDNIFAKNLDVNDLSGNVRFELATAFEVFEHWADPITEFKKILEYTDSILFSTEIQPSQTFLSSDDWTYFIPEIGQHISFYTVESLKVLASKFKMQLYTNSQSLHLLTSKMLTSDPFFQPFPPTTNMYFAKKAVRKMLKKFRPSHKTQPEIVLENLIPKDSATAKAKLLSRK